MRTPNATLPPNYQVTPEIIGPRLAFDDGGQTPLACVTQKRRYQLLTPLFGGGVEAGIPDISMPVSGRSVRGHLRFWWRAVRGGQFGGDLRAMRAAEFRLWGGAGTQNQTFAPMVNLHVWTEASEHRPTKYITPYHADGEEYEEEDFVEGEPNQDTWNKVEYVGFPLKANDNKDASDPLLINVRFGMEISFPEAERIEVEAALWAWETFGGIGARARRGFGALRLMKIDNRNIGTVGVSNVENKLREAFSNHITTGPWPIGVPYLSLDDLKVVGNNVGNQQQAFSNSDAAWAYLIEKFKNFRQSRNPNNNGQPYGRSHWPEPDELRHLTKQNSGNHRPVHPATRPPVAPAKQVFLFPRGVFGLPIIFSFQNNPHSHHGQGFDPWKITLRLQNHDRLASPLLLRPYPCNNGAVAVACVLKREGPLPHAAAPLQLVDQEGPLHPDPIVDTVLTATEAGTVRPLRIQGPQPPVGKTDVMQAFLDTLT